MFDKSIHRDEFRLRILLTNQCNKDCDFCLNDFQPKEPALYLNPFWATDCLRAYGQFMKSVKETSIVTFSGGEPGLHPMLDLFLAHARYWCDVVKLVTNGTALNPDYTRFVDCWHVGVTDKDPRVVDFMQYAKDITVQIVVTEQEPMRSLVDLIWFYCSNGMKVKLFADFYSEKQDELKEKISHLASYYLEGVIQSRFTGIQENRGKACEGCTQRCITLKALWVFPDGTSSTCPQGLIEHYDLDNSWDEIMEKAYKAHSILT